MTRKFKILTIVLLFSLFMTSCGNLATKKTYETAGTHSVSDSSISGTALQETVWLNETMIHRFANSTNVYLPHEDSDLNDDTPDYPYDGFISYPKDDMTKKEKVEIDQFAFLFCVTEEGVYYCKEDNTLWRIPIEKNSQGTDTVRLEDNEKILSESEKIIEQSGGFINDSCIVYSTNENVIKYDHNTGKKDIHTLEGNISLIPINESCLIVCAYGEYYFWNLNTNQWTHFSNCEDAFNEPISATGKDSLFYDVQEYEKEEIRQYEFGAEKDKCLFSDQQISKACQSYVDKKGGEYESFFIWQLFYYKKHLYVEAQVDWTKNKEYRMNYVVFQVDLTAKPELKLYENVMDYFEKESIEKSAKKKFGGNDKVVWNAANAIYLTDGKFNMIMQGAKDIEIHCFDLDKNTGKNVTQKDLEYYLPYYDLHWEEVYNDLVMEGGMNYAPEGLEVLWEDY